MANGENRERRAAVYRAGVTPDVFPWEQHPIPPLLYKYFPPERFHVLTDCEVRFSQRQVFEDRYELLPDVAQFGTADEMLEFFETDEVLRRHPPALRRAVVNHILSSSERHAALIADTQSWLTGPNEFVVLCLSETPASDRMWHEYAENEHGFVVAFNTQHPAFRSLHVPGRIGKVEYSDQPFPSFLSSYGANAFFRKRTRYSYEEEWRSIRHTGRFAAEQVRMVDGLPIYLGRFDPACVSAILIRPGCRVEWELRHLLAIDARYRHVLVVDSSNIV